MPKKPDKRFVSEYFGHFFKFLATFIFMIGISLFLSSFTSGA